MDNFTWWSGLLALLGSGGIIVTVIKISGYISERIDKRREAKRLEAVKAVQDAVELHKSNIDARQIDQEFVKEELWKMLQEEKAETQALKLEMQDLRNLNSLSHSVLRKISSDVRRIRRRADVIFGLVQGVPDHEPLQQAVEALIEELDRLEQALP